MEATSDAADGEHPAVAHLRDRPGWSPGPGLGLLSRVLPGVRRVAASVATLEAAWAAEARRALAADEPVWVVLGDSTAQGVGAARAGTTWVLRLAEARRRAGAPLGIVNLSLSGAVVADVIDDQLPVLAELGDRIGFVSSSVGSNDLMGVGWPPTVARRLRALVAELPAEAVVTTVPSPRFSPSGRYVNGALGQAAAERGLGVADVVPHLVAGPRGTADGFHPSDRGYEAWVRAVAPHLGVDPDAVPSAVPDPETGDDSR